MIKPENRKTTKPRARSASRICALRWKFNDDGQPLFWLPGKSRRPELYLPLQADPELLHQLRRHTTNQLLEQLLDDFFSQECVRAGYMAMRLADLPEGHEFPQGSAGSFSVAWLDALVAADSAVALASSQKEADQLYAASFLAPAGIFLTANPAFLESRRHDERWTQCSMQEARAMARDEAMAGPIDALRRKDAALADVISFISALPCDTPQGDDAPKDWVALRGTVALGQYRIQSLWNAID